ncbi:hypothetical protein C8J57DRAFT_1503557 [Mycena rebaudengoi]|nr:hypothetical protein C8J57DRAFT_1503557 [Mycena rebaudengoi]
MSLNCTFAQAARLAGSHGANSYPPPLPGTPRGYLSKGCLTPKPNPNNFLSMNFLVVDLLASFMAVAAANPVGDIGARDAALEARILVPKHCNILPFLRCDGGIDQEIACGDAWSCPGNGLHPVIDNATCAAQRLDTVVHALARRPTPQTAHITRTSSRIHYEPSSPPGYIIELTPTRPQPVPTSKRTLSLGTLQSTPSPDTSRRSHLCVIKPALAISAGSQKRARGVTSRIPIHKPAPAISAGTKRKARAHIRRSSVGASASPTRRETAVPRHWDENAP